MPYTIAPKGDQFCVFKAGEDGEPTGSSLGCHPTRKAAGDQIGAIESEAGKKGEKKKPWMMKAEAWEDEMAELVAAWTSEHAFGYGVAILDRAEGPLELDVLIASSAAQHQLGMRGRTFYPWQGMAFVHEREVVGTWSGEGCVEDLALALFDSAGTLIDATVLQVGEQASGRVSRFGLELPAGELGTLLGVTGMRVVARDFGPDERKKLAGEGKALPDGSFPIANRQDLRNAIQAYGRAGDKAKAKAHIIRRAKALGLEGLLPEGWG